MEQNAMKRPRLEPSLYDLEQGALTVRVSPLSFFKIVMSSLRTFAGTEIPKFKSKRGTFQFRYSLTSLGSISWLFLPSLQTNQIS